MVRDLLGESLCLLLRQPELVARFPLRLPRGIECSLCLREPLRCLLELHTVCIGAQCRLFLELLVNLRILSEGIHFRFCFPELFERATCSLFELPDSGALSSL